MDESAKLMREKAIFKAPRKSISDETVFACVNGKPIRLKRGVDVEIPKSFALVLERAQKQEEYALGYTAEKAENVDKI